MGVKGLETSDILNEIGQWKRTNKNMGKPIIVFDLMGFVHNFGQTRFELCLGGRHHLYIQQFTDFVEKLLAADVELAFFCDGQLLEEKDQKWCKRRNEEFGSTYEQIQPNRNIDTGSKAYKRMGCKSIVKNLQKLIEDNDYGKCEISTQVDCDQAIGVYANSNNVMAIFASDTDFLIYQGKFKWWNTKTLNMETMKVDIYDPHNLRELLNLSDEQMKYFATIVGNDLTNNFTKGCNFYAVANYCRSIHSNENQQSLFSKIANYMQKDRQGLIDAITNSINSYNINITTETEFDEINKFCSSYVVLFSFWNGKTFQYEANYLDFLQRNNANNNNNNQSMLDALIEVFRKIGGILLKSKADANMKLKIVSKYGVHEEYMLKEHTPIYPNNDVRIEDLIFHSQVNNTNIKWDLLLWSIGLNAQFQHHLKTIPPKHILTVVALTFLTKAGEITTMQADALMMSQFSILDESFDVNTIVVYNRRVESDIIRTGHLFNRIVTLMWDTFTVCGLQQLIVRTTIPYEIFQYKSLTSNSK